MEQNKCIINGHVAVIYGKNWTNWHDSNWMQSQDKLFDPELVEEIFELCRMDYSQLTRGSTHFEFQKNRIRILANRLNPAYDSHELGVTFVPVGEQFRVLHTMFSNNGKIQSLETIEINKKWAVVDNDGICSVYSNQNIPNSDQNEIYSVLARKYIRKDYSPEEMV